MRGYAPRSVVLVVVVVDVVEREGLRVLDLDGFQLMWVEPEQLEDGGGDLRSSPSTKTNQRCAGKPR